MKISQNNRMKQLERQLEDAWRQIRELKAKLETRNRFGWDPASSELLHRTYDALARLEWEADPRKGMLWSEPISGSPANDPMPGADTAASRRRLYRFQRRLAALLDNLDAEWQAEIDGVRPPRRAVRPYCPTCGRRGLEGDTVCGRGCGSLIQPETEAAA